MKIKFIPLLFVLGYITAHSQITTSGGAKMFISSGTTLFSTGDITVTNNTDKITNNGNVRISDGIVSTPSNSEDNFVLTYTALDDYGQLIIDSKVKSTGEVTVEKQLYDAGIYVYFGTPFSNYSYTEFTKDITKNDAATPLEITCTAGVNNNCKRLPSRWERQPVFQWHNTRYRQDPFQGGNFVPGVYYTLRKEQFKGIGADFTGKISFKGIPYVAGTDPNGGNGVPSSIPFPNRVGENFPIGEGAFDVYNIRYYTYLNDPFANIPTAYDATTSNSVLDAAGYSDRLLRLSNPYTSNLDLAKLTNNFANIIGVGSEGAVTVAATSKVRYQGQMQASTVSNGLIGDYLKIIPPMTNFFIKADTSIPYASSLVLDLYGNSTNSQTTPQTFEKTTYNPSNVSTTPLSRAVKSSNSSFSDKYQLNLILSANNVQVSNTYIAAGADLVTGEVNKTEARKNMEIYSNGILYGTNNIYTIPEAVTGGVAPGYEDVKLYINVINTDAAKVAIPVGVAIVDEDKGKEFTFTSDLRFNMSPLEKERTNFDDPDAKFYFHDKKNNQIIEITSDFSYKVNLNESTADRFEIFWRETGLMNNEDIVAISDLTSVYKTGSEYKVRFNKTWQKADITIFNVLGQLVSSIKNVNTQEDYLLPIYNNTSSMYIVVITNPITGEKVTKKIIK